MKYFFYFSKEDYVFSDTVIKGVTNLSQFTNFLYDQFDDVSFYTYHEMKGNERLDQISYQLYGDTMYYWTIPFMNADLVNIWKDMYVDYNTLENKLRQLYPNKSFLIQPSETIYDKFRINELIGINVNSIPRESSGRIVNIFPTRGYLEIEGIDDDEADILRQMNGVSVVSRQTDDEVQIRTIVDSFKSPLYYFINTNDDGIPNIQYTTYRNENASSYTILDDEMTKNEVKSKIRVIRKEFIRDVTKAFIEKMKE